MSDELDWQLSSVFDRKKEKTTSKCIVVLAHLEALVLLCEESTALDFVAEFGSGAGVDGFVPEQSCVSLEMREKLADGVYVAELHVVDGGAESWEMPHIRDYYAEIRNFRPITVEEWKVHLAGEWPEGFDVPEPEQLPGEGAACRICGALPGEACVGPHGSEP